MAINDSSVNDIPSSSADTPFTASRSDVWINSLWFTSLTLSLITAFLGVVAKQWLSQYGAPASGPPRTRALIRQGRYFGLQEWHVPTLIGILPIILYISLASYFAGLVILLQTMISSLSYFVASLVGTVYAAYLISSFLPIFYPRCPYRTGITPKLFHLYNCLPSLYLSDPKVNFSTNVERLKRWNWITWVQRVKVSFTSSKNVGSWKDAESDASISTGGLLEGKAVCWLHKSSYNPTAEQIALEAVSGFEPTFYRYRDRWDIDTVTFGEIPKKALIRVCTSGRNVSEVARELVLYLRGDMQLKAISYEAYIPEGLFLSSGRLPTEVWDFWSKEKSDDNLNTLMRCGLYTDNDAIHKSLVATQSGVDTTHLPSTVWVSLFRLELAWKGQHVNHEFDLAAWLLTILRDAQFFVDPMLVPDAMLATPILRPNRAMCLAMLDLIRPEIDSPLSSNNEIYALVEILERLPIANDAVMSVLLECLVQSTNKLRMFEQDPRWTPMSRITVRDALLHFLASPWCKTTVSSPEPQQSIQFTRKAFLVLTRIFVSPRYGFDDQEQLNNNANVILEQYVKTDAFKYRNLNPDENLLLGLEMNRHDISTSEGIVAMDLIPTLYSNSTDLYKRPRWEARHSWLTSPALRLIAIVPLYLESVYSPKVQDTTHSPSLHETGYVAQQLRYIHDTSDNLYYLCRILLRDLARLQEQTSIFSFHSSATEDILSSIMKLLQMDRTHSSWRLCMNKLREWLPEEEENYFSSALEPGYNNSRAMKAIYDGVADIQYILGIEDDDLDHQEWRERYERYRKHRYGFRRVHSHIPFFVSSSERLRPILAEGFTSGGA